jgi:hypothetical protein
MMSSKLRQPPERSPTSIKTREQKKVKDLDSDFLLRIVIVRRSKASINGNIIGYIILYYL